MLQNQTHIEENQKHLDQLQLVVDPLLIWYRANKRDLPWRHSMNAYHVWISEIMLQQTRVEAVKPYYIRFLSELPSIQDLAEVEEDRLLKLWQGLGYYNRARNLQKAAQLIVQEYQGQFPRRYEEILSLPGIGSYTAGAISSIAFQISKPAVDGNVLRVLSRYLAYNDDILKNRVRSYFERLVEHIIPQGEASDFNQSLIELGALVCIPNGEPNCSYCPLSLLCRANREGLQQLLPIRSKSKPRRLESHTILVIRDHSSIVLHKRPKKGLLAGLYELPNRIGHLTEEEVHNYCNKIGVNINSIKTLPASTHIFSHIEWNMMGYEIWVQELAQVKSPYFVVKREMLEEVYSIPTAFATYVKAYLDK